MREKGSGFKYVKYDVVENKQLMLSPEGDWIGYPLTIHKAPKNGMYIHTTESLDLNPNYLQNWYSIKRYAKNAKNLPKIAQFTIVHTDFCKNDLLNIVINCLYDAI